MRKPTVTAVAESDHAAPASAPVTRLVESGPTTRAAGAGDHPEGQEPGAYRRTISPTGRDRARPLIGMTALSLLVADADVGEGDLSRAASGPRDVLPDSPPWLWQVDATLARRPW